MTGRIDRRIAVLSLGDYMDLPSPESIAEYVKHYRFYAQATV